MCDPEILELQAKLLSTGLHFLTPYPKEENFIVEYIDFSQNPKRIVQQQIGDIFNRRTVSTYLALMFPNEIFTINDVELAHYIMEILIRKSTHIECIGCMDGDRVDFCHDNSGEEEATYLNVQHNKSGRRSYVNLMLRTQNIFVPCYGLKDQYGYSSKFINESGDCPPRYYLIEILRDKRKLRTFFDFWKTVPDYRTVYQILHQILNLPAEIADMIIVMAAKPWSWRSIVVTSVM